MPPRFPRDGACARRNQQRSILPARPDCRRKKRARRGPRPRAWEAIRLVAAQRQGSVETKYGATFGSVHETGNRWGHVGKEAGRGLHSPIHPVCDGAEWIALQIREIFGADARALTDFYHVSEYLAAAAPGCRPAAPHAWRRTQQRRESTG